MPAGTAAARNIPIDSLVPVSGDTAVSDDGAIAVALAYLIRLRTAAWRAENAVGRPVSAAEHRQLADLVVELAELWDAADDTTRKTAAAELREQAAELRRCADRAERPGCRTPLSHQYTPVGRCGRCGGYTKAACC